MIIEHSIVRGGMVVAYGMRASNFFSWSRDGRALRNARFIGMWR